MKKRVMGIVNATPDSFFSSSRVVAPDAAADAARSMFDAGADFVDVGGESTRPFADPVDADTELERIIPVIERIAGEMPVSVDTRHAEVAVAAVEAGASIINDVSSQLHDVAANLGVGWIPMHMQGDPTTMQIDPHYDDVVEEVLESLIDAAERGRQAGVEKIWIDPGIGFGKTYDHNLALIANIDRFVETGWPVLVGVSRKGFIGTMHQQSDGAPERIPAGDRLEGSLALATWCYSQGVDMMRVHDVPETLQVAQVVGV